MPAGLTERRAALAAALGFALLPPSTPELKLVHGWLDTWRGIGDVVIGMSRQQYDCKMRQYEGRQWRATFYVMAPMHSFTSYAATALLVFPPLTAPLARALLLLAGGARGGQGLTVGGGHALAAGEITFGVPKRQGFGGESNSS